MAHTIVSPCKFQFVTSFFLVGFLWKIFARQKSLNIFQINLGKLMFLNRGEANDLTEFLQRKTTDDANLRKQRQNCPNSDDDVSDDDENDDDETASAHLAISMKGGNQIPILVVQRQKHKNWMDDLYTGVDVPHYIWVERGTKLTPAMLFERVHDSIYNSLAKPKYRNAFDDELTQCFEKQKLLSFGTTTSLDHDGQPFSEQRPYMVCFGCTSCSPH